LNCKYTIDSSNGFLRIEGNSDMVEVCSDHIIRALSRNQEWHWSYSTAGGGGMKVSITKPYAEGEFQNLVNQEYRLPKFLELLFQESVFNHAAGKLRVSFLIMYSVLERAVKLLYV